MARSNEEAAAYMRDYRARVKERKKGASVTDIATKRRESAEGGAVERAVRDACEGWPKAKEQPETVAIALELARVMDTGASTAQVQASSQLTKILESLRGGSTHGKLAQLRDGALRERNSPAVHPASSETDP